jgi:hypothetical protein
MKYPTDNSVGYSCEYIYLHHQVSLFSNAFSSFQYHPFDCFYVSYPTE